MDPTRRLLDRLTAWSPVLLLAALAALTYWLDAQIRAPEGGARTPRHEPDMFIENFRAVTLGEDGKPRQSIRAARAQHYADDLSTELVEPRLELTEPGRPLLALTAQQGVVSADRERATFRGDVTAVRDAPPGGTADGTPGGRFTTSGACGTLTARPQARRIGTSGRSSPTCAQADDGSPSEARSCSHAGSLSSVPRTRWTMPSARARCATEAEALPVIHATSTPAAFSRLKPMPSSAWNALVSRPASST